MAHGRSRTMSEKGLMSENEKELKTYGSKFVGLRARWKGGRLVWHSLNDRRKELVQGFKMGPRGLGYYGDKVAEQDVHGRAAVKAILCLEALRLDEVKKRKGRRCGTDPRA